MQATLSTIEKNRVLPTDVLELSAAALTGERGIEAFRNRLQPPLVEFVSRKTERYSHYSNDPSLRSVWEYPRAMVAGRGKRIRPYVAHLMFDSLREEGTEEAEVLHVLLAIELFHLFCLVHDDIIDQGQQRHSLSTAQRFVAARLAGEDRLRDPAHIGNSQAMLLGDMIFSWSQEAFYTGGNLSPQIMRQTRRYFSLMIDEVVIGEMMDVDMMTRRTTSSEAIHQKMLLKTASYTFIRPLQIGAALAGQGAAHEQFCYDLGFSLGIAFQVQDDLLDLTGTAGGSQKTILSDLREHQHTYFSQYIFDHGTPAEKTRLRDLMGSELTAEDQPRVLELFDSSGALEYGASVIRRYLDEAHDLLDNAPATLARPLAFREMICAIENRAL